MHGIRTPAAVVIAVFCGFLGGGLAVDAPRLDQALWYDHASSIIAFLPVFLLARSWKWLICGIPGLIAGLMMLALRDDLVNRWPEVSRGPAFAMVGAWLLTWFPSWIAKSWKGGAAYAEYAARTTDVAEATGESDSRGPNPYFPAGIVCLLVLPVWTFLAIHQVESQNLKRTDAGRAILVETQILTVVFLLGGVLLPFLGWIRHWRFRSRRAAWMSTTWVVLFLVVPVQLVLLWVLAISVNGIFQGGK
jgi:hypothetical protein